MSEKEKVCGRCFLSLPDTKDYFYMRKNRNGSIVTRTYCKECDKDTSTTNYDKNRGEILDKLKEKYRRGLQKSK